MSKTVRLNVMMFLQFFVWGVFFVPLGEYLTKIFGEYEAEGTLNSIIGGIYSTQTWAALAAPLIVGYVADRLFNKEKVNGVLHLIGGTMLWWCSTITDSPDNFYWLMLTFFLCYMPTLALVNTITFQNVASVESDFPKIRLWGTIGWIFSGLLVAESFFGIFPLPLLPGIEGAGRTAVPLQLGAVVSIVYGFYSFTLPASPPQGKDQPTNVAKILGLDAVKLFANWNYFVFALSSFLISIPLAFYYARTNDFVSKVEFGANAPAVMAIGQFSEIFFMALVPFFLKRLGVKMMLFVGMMAWALRYALFGLMPSSAAILVIGIALHGVCYDFFFVTGQLYTDRVAPRGMRTSAQALIGLLTYGAGMLVGNLLHGKWGDMIDLKPTSREGWLEGAREFWLMPSVFAFGIALFFLATFWDKSEAASGEIVEEPDVAGGELEGPAIATDPA